MVLNRLGDKRGTNLSNLVRFNEAMKTVKQDLLWHPEYLYIYIYI
jgi:hypothetical protein